MDSPAASADSSTSDWDFLSGHIRALQHSHNLLEHRVLHLEERIRDLEDGSSGVGLTLSSVQTEQQNISLRLSWLESFVQRIRQFLLGPAP